MEYIPSPHTKSSRKQTIGGHEGCLIVTQLSFPSALDSKIKYSSCTRRETHARQVNNQFQLSQSPIPPTTSIEQFCEFDVKIQ